MIFFKIFKVRNLIKTEKMVQKWLLGQIVKNDSNCPKENFTMAIGNRIDVTGVIFTISHSIQDRCLEVVATR